ncbi:hypothetical protein A3F37_01195 [Candidatus Saccharibacteria bacterium RIFCSPHIGHO2_12_FULL_41_12]|nr:MAG: hypothetical protein A3F37_01195 [Candidatus Saccharibacteria bacterium RIFCSPHIGHO2_12_FULL_41_12]
MDEILAYFDSLGLDSELTQKTPVNKGHMSYEKAIYTNDSERIFVKKFVEDANLNPTQSAHAVAYLQKENTVINQLSTIDTVPEHAELIDGSLVLPAYTEELGWFWEAPEDEELRPKYIKEILNALFQKESVSVNLDESVVAPSQQTLERKGWQKLIKTPGLKPQVADKLKQHKTNLYPMTIASGQELLNNLDNLMAKFKPIDATELTAFCHHDARQHNIAWHPFLGVRIVDWSWAGIGLPNSDSTMFLIDLTKSEIDISQYLDEYFNPKHAYTLIGYWLARAIEPPNKSNPEVRLHQLASAITAYNLLRLRETV